MFKKFIFNVTPKTKPRIVIIGDSHVNIYSECVDLITEFNITRVIHTDSEDVNRNGRFIPYLMNTIGDRGHLLLQHHIDKYKDNTDYMMFVFGEPDVRIHFNKQINELGRDENEVVYNVASKYVAKLRQIVPSHIKIIVRYLLPQRQHSMFGDWVPRGSLQERVRYTQKMNIALQQICYQMRVLFLTNSEFANLTTVEGELKDEYCDGLTHYNSASVKYIINELSQIVNA